jgi:hypothetical protein
MYIKKNTNFLDSSNSNNKLQASTTFLRSLVMNIKNYLKFEGFFH